MGLDPARRPVSRAGRLEVAAHAKARELVLHELRQPERHLGGIILAAKEAITNASAEGLNSVVQMLKHVAHGYRSRERFRNAIYFHLGGLDLYPHAIEA